MGILLFTILGGLFGWIYGGNALGLIGKHYGETWKARFNVIDKLIYYVAYGVSFSFLLPILNFYAFITLAVSQLARRAISWGKYIGGLIHGRWGKKGGVEFIDQLIFANGNKLDYFKFRCILALGIIGALGGAVLAAGLLIAYAFTGMAAPLTVLWLVPALAFKGVVYWACVEISGLINGQHEGGRNKGWGYGDSAYSAYSWGFIAAMLWGA